MHVTMSDKELSRINVIQSVIESCMFFRYFTIIVGLQADGSPSCCTRPYHSLLEKQVLAGSRLEYFTLHFPASCRRCLLLT